jgi:hypothetical protein
VDWMKSEEEVTCKLRERIHRARRKWFRANEGSVKGKQELYEEFKLRLRTPNVLLREHRDIAVLLWVLGEFEKSTLAPGDPVSAYEHTRDEANGTD